MPKTRGSFKKGHTPYFKGRTKETCEAIRRMAEAPTSLSTRLKISASKLGEKNAMWKGDEVGYSQLHTWVRRHKMLPPFCERCEVKPPHDLANISGEYKRDVNDYKWLCRRCHMETDSRLEKLSARMRARAQAKRDAKFKKNKPQ